MCKITILKRTKNGLLLQCENSGIFQLLFKNLNFNLTEEEWNSFLNYVNSVDEFYWEQEYKNSIYEKRIPIPTVQTNLMILLDLSELIELRELLTYQNEREEYIHFSAIDYKMVLN